MPTGPPSLPTPDWVRLELPPEVVSGAREMGLRCGWDVRHLGGRQWEIRQKAGYGNSVLELMRASRQAKASQAGEAQHYAFLGEARQDELDRSGELAARARAELSRLLAEQSAVSTWAAFQLAVVGMPDSAVAGMIQQLYESIAGELPTSSIWSVTVHAWLLSRFAVVRTLFGLEHSAEQLADASAANGPHLVAGWGLMSSHGFQTGQYVDALLLSQAPWLPGIASARVGVMVVVMFGRLLAGRGPGRAELIDLYQPNLYSALAEPSVMKMPAFDHQDLEAALPWWIQRVNELLTVALDPANFRDATGRHDSALHYSVLLSLDRLFAVVNSILVASRRDEFIRKTLMFEGLDIIDGLTTRSGNYEDWAAPRKAEKRLTTLEAQLPEPAARLLLPRCAAAVRALADIKKGFFIPARARRPGGLELNVGSSSRLVPWDQAVAIYLRMVRNGSHSFRRPLTDPLDRALFSSHTGNLAPELSDLPFMYLVWAAVQSLATRASQPTVTAAASTAVNRCVKRCAELQISRDGAGKETTGFARSGRKALRSTRIRQARFSAYKTAALPLSYAGRRCASLPTPSWM